MDRHDWLAERFEASRSHLHSVAYRVLGSSSEAEDAVQEAWFRLSRADTSSVENLGGWLSTVVARVCLDMLRARQARPEEPLGEIEPATGDAYDEAGDPERQALLADAVGPALLVVLDTLAPAERVAFVLHDLFGVPFDEIGPVVGRTSTAARQLASRARRRVQGANAAGAADPARQRAVVDAFLAAARGGDIQALLAVLDPNVVVRADAAAVAIGTEAERRGAQAAAEWFSRRAKAARPATVAGTPGLVWAVGGQPRVAFRFTLAGDRILTIDLIADPEHLSRLDLHFDH